MRGELQRMLDLIRESPPRRRVPLSNTNLHEFALGVPERSLAEHQQLFGDSLVSGGANPLGLGARLWRDGDAAVLEVSLGPAFEGAPGRAHGGVVAALIDETMGIVLVLHGELAFTVQLQVAYRAPTPVGELLVARAHVVARDGRKLTIKAVVHCGELLVAEATALFIGVNATTVLAPLAP